MGATSHRLMVSGRMVIIYGLRALLMVIQILEILLSTHTTCGPALVSLEIVKVDETGGRAATGQ